MGNKRSEVVIWLISASTVVGNGLRVLFESRGWRVHWCDPSCSERCTPLMRTPNLVLFDGPADLCSCPAVAAVRGQSPTVVYNHDGIASIDPEMVCIHGSMHEVDILATIEAVLMGSKRKHVAHGSCVASAPKLTRREREVLAFLGQGLSNKVIARQIGVSTKTIECHKENLKDKLAIESNDELLRVAIRVRSDRMKCFH